MNAQTCGSRATPLQRASYCGFVEIVSSLLQVKGIQVNLQDCDGRTALHKACEQGHTEVRTLAHTHPKSDILQVVKLLLKHGASTALTDNRGQIPRTLCRSDAVISVLDAVAPPTVNTK